MVGRQLTENERHIMNEIAGQLRDRIIDVVEDWSQSPGDSLRSKEFSTDDSTAIEDQILQDAFRELVWRSMSKRDRDDPPPRNAVLQDLRLKHPDLECVGTLKTFLRIPVFRENSVKAAFDKDFETISWIDGAANISLRKPLLNDPADLLCQGHSCMGRNR